MTDDTLDILRCPYCGGRLELVESIPHRRDGGALEHGALGCHCCLFPVVAGIPVLHLRPESVAALAALEADRPDEAFRALIAPDEPEVAERFAEAARAPGVTYQELVEALGGGFEGGYFLYRFSDPSYVAASAVIGAVAGEVLSGGGRAIDLCGGSGHLTRTLLGRSSPPPVIADLYFAKLWLAANFVAPGCAPVCCDGNAPLPFERGAFRFAMCADAFMFIWTKRQFVSEMARLIDGDAPGALVITHTHNALVWSQSHGQALSPQAYGELFETLPARLFAESRLLDDVVRGGPLDLARRDAPGVLDAEEALAIVATRSEAAVFRPHALPPRAAVGGDVLRVNPLYGVRSSEGDVVTLRLSFPSSDYEDEFGACRRYLAEEVTLDAALLDALAEGRRSPEVLELLERRVVLELPERYT